MQLVAARWHIRRARGKLRLMTATALDAAPSPRMVRRVQARLLAWWDAGHRDLPWRRTRDPYAILVSEFMLQQTQVARVVPKFLAFIERFPTFEALARAPVADVIRQWAGLGYNRRAVHLHRLAGVVVEAHRGALPHAADELAQLPGIGPYTARAVAAIAFNAAAAAVDTNVRRVLTRVVDGPDSPRGPRAVQSLADTMLAEERPGDWTQALMELGALICLPVPACPRCPLLADCATSGQAGVIRERRAAYRATGGQAKDRYPASNRFYRGRIVAMLRAEAGSWLADREIGRRLRLDFTDADRDWLEGLLSGLEGHGLIERAGGRVALPGAVR